LYITRSSTISMQIKKKSTNQLYSGNPKRPKFSRALEDTVAWVIIASVSKVRGLLALRLVCRDIRNAIDASDLHILRVLGETPGTKRTCRYIGGRVCVGEPRRWSCGMETDVEEDVHLQPPFPVATPGSSFPKVTFSATSIPVSALSETPSSDLYMRETYVSIKMSSINLATLTCMVVCSPWTRGGQPYAQGVNANLIPAQMRFYVHPWVEAEKYIPAKNGLKESVDLKRRSEEYSDRLMQTSPVLDVAYFTDVEACVVLPYDNSWYKWSFDVTYGASTGIRIKRIKLLITGPTPVLPADATVFV